MFSVVYGILWLLWFLGRPCNTKTTIPLSRTVAATVKYDSMTTNGVTPTRDSGSSLVPVALLFVEAASSGSAGDAVDVLDRHGRCLRAGRKFRTPGFPFLRGRLGAFGGCKI